MEDPVFKEGFKKYIDSVRSNCYMFDVNKCCGYSEIVPIFKYATCADLYRNIMHQFDIKPEIKMSLYARDANNNTMMIQNDNTPIRNIIVENSNFFKPIYPLPTSVVYKLVYKFETEGSSCSCCSCNSNS